MAKKDKTVTVYVVTENGEPLRAFERDEDAYAYIASRHTAGGDLPTFMAVECEQVG